MSTRETIIPKGMENKVLTAAGATFDDVVRVSRDGDERYVDVTRADGSE